MSAVFSLEGRGLKLDTRADIEPHLAELRAMETVHEVRLGGNTLGIEACTALAEVLATLSELQTADLSDIFTGRLITEIPDSLAALCNALKDSTTLHTINLSDNAFGGRVVDPMVPFLTHNRSLRHLLLTNNGLGPEGATVVASAILENTRLQRDAGSVAQLRSIVCGRNRLENGSASKWSEAFAALPHLEEVRLPQNGIRAEGITQIVTGLANCPRMRVLDLQDNIFVKRDVEPGTVPPNGTRALARSLSSWPQLEVLNVSDCLLGRREGMSLALALSKGTNKMLKTLRLQYGELDHRSLNLLATAIRSHMAALETLEINGNIAHEDDDCIQNIRHALEFHGHQDALDDLDDMEDPVEAEGGSESDKRTEDEPESPVQAKVLPPTVSPSDGADELVTLMDKVSLGQ